MEHNVCKGGCNGVSDQPGAVCNTEGCSMHGQPMEKCECGDMQSHAQMSGPEQQDSQMQDAPKAE